MVLELAYGRGESIANRNEGVFVVMGWRDVDGLVLELHVHRYFKRVAVAVVLVGQLDGDAATDDIGGKAFEGGRSLVHVTLDSVRSTKSPENDF